MNSVEMARTACRKDAQHSLLIGTTSRVVELTTSEHEKIAATLSLAPAEVSNVCSVTNKCFLSNLGHEGTVLSSNNTIVALLHGVDSVISVDKFLSVRCKHQSCQLICEGTVKPLMIMNNLLFVL